MEASDKVNKHTNNLYSAKIYNIATAHYVPVPRQGRQPNNEQILLT